MATVIGKAKLLFPPCSERTWRDQNVISKEITQAEMSNHFVDVLEGPLDPASNEARGMMARRDCNGPFYKIEYRTSEGRQWGDCCEHELEMVPD